MTLKTIIRTYFRPIFDLKIWLHDLFFPNNVVKCRSLPRNWIDRDELMFHAMFQILVDFIEIEQPYVDWDFKYKRHRNTDLKKMREYVDKWYGDASPDRAGQLDADIIHGDPVEYNNELDRQRVLHEEILHLYEWYKTEQYEYPDGISGYEACIAHEDKIDDMLKRLLKIRDCLWT